MITAFIGSLLVLYSFMNDEGLKLWALITGVLLVLAGISLVNDSAERARARANKQYYWAHYYDKDQVEARKCMRVPEPVPDRDDEEDYEFFASIFDDD